jgi:hypothetical protein
MVLGNCGVGCEWELEGLGERLEATFEWFWRIVRGMQLHLNELVTIERGSKKFEGSEPA